MIQEKVIFPGAACAYKHTSHAVGAQHMSPLDLPAAGALVEALHILQGLACHLTVAFLHVRGLLLGDGAEDGFPEVGEDGRNGDGDRQGQGVEEAEGSEPGHTR